MEKKILQIDKRISFMTSIGKMDTSEKIHNYNDIPDPLPADNNPAKRTKIINYTNILLLFIISCQLWYLANEYLSRANAVKQSELVSKVKAFNEKQQALKTQSQNFARDANNTIERINKIVYEIHELKKDTTYVPEKFDITLNFYNSTLFYIKQNKFEKASKMAISSINNGNIAIMYAENTRDDLRKLLDKKFQEEEKIMKEISMARDNVRTIILRAGEILKTVASKNPEKFAPITFEESKRLLKEAAKIFNESVGNTNAKKVNEAMNLALKAEKFAKMCDEEIASAVSKFIEETRVKKALTEALKVKDMLEKAKKKKTDKK